MKADIVHVIASRIKDNMGYFKIYFEHSFCLYLVLSPVPVLLAHIPESFSEINIRVSLWTKS